MKKTFYELPKKSVTIIVHRNTSHLHQDIKVIGDISEVLDEPVAFTSDHWSFLCLDSGQLSPWKHPWVGWGTHTDGATVKGHGHIMTGIFNYLGMLVISHALNSWTDKLQYSLVQVPMDITTVKAYLQGHVGTKLQCLLMETTSLLGLAHTIDSRLLAGHIPGILSGLADCLSWKNKVVSTEWYLHPQDIKWITMTSDTPHLDLLRHVSTTRLLSMTVQYQTRWMYMWKPCCWEGIFAYTIYAKLLLFWVLRKVENLICIVILIALVWLNRFPRLFLILIEYIHFHYPYIMIYFVCSNQTYFAAACTTITYMPGN